MAMRKLKDYTPTRFMAPDSHYDKDAADYPKQLSFKSKMLDLKIRLPRY